MTAAPDASTAELRAVVVLALQRAVDSLEGGYAALLRDQLRNTEVDASLYGPSVFCLGLGRLITGTEDLALPAATALGLLEEMARVFVDLEAAGSDLVSSWGMPRSLNAGDAFYAAAQRVLLDDQGLAPPRRLRALGVLSAASRTFAEALHAWGPGGRDGVARASRALYPAAAALAALCCDLDADLTARLAAIAEDLASQPAATLEGALQKAAALNLRKT